MPAEHDGAGGVLHVASTNGYEPHAPAEQLPPPVYVRFTVPDKHTAAGTALQFTPLQGSALQAPEAQPNAQAVSVGA